MFTAALFIILPNWKQPECSPIVDGINKLWCVHFVEYYIAMKNNELFSYRHNTEQAHDHVWSACWKVVYLDLSGGPLDVYTCKNSIRSLRTWKYVILTSIKKKRSKQKAIVCHVLDTEWARNKELSMCLGQRRQQTHCPGCCLDSSGALV